MNIVPFDSSAIANLQKFAGEASGNLLYMKFTKEGRFVFGQEGEVIDSTEEFAVDLRELRRGYICWKDGAPAGEEMGLVLQGETIHKGTLPDIPDSDGWKEQYSVVLQSLDTEERFEFKTSSNGGTRALQELVNEVMDQIKRGNPSPVPIVTLHDNPYKHSQFGMIHKPQFKVSRWGQTSAEAPLQQGAGRQSTFDDVPFDVDEDAPPAPQARRATAQPVPPAPGRKATAQPAPPAPAPRSTRRVSA